jgi:hypothetical protein
MAALLRNPKGLIFLDLSSVLMLEFSQTHKGAFSCLPLQMIWRYERLFLRAMERLPSLSTGIRMNWQ